MTKLKIEYLPLTELIAWPANPKLHSPDLGESIRRYGFNDPVALNAHPQAAWLLEGHGRVAALKTRKAAGEAPPDHIQIGPDGEWLVPVLKLHLPPGRAEAYALAHNRLTAAGDPEAGAWAEPALAAVLADLDRQGLPTDALGWEHDEIVKLLREARAPLAVPEMPDPSAELTARWGVTPGQVWTVGRHRIGCGSASDEAFVRRVWGEARPDLICTDPPYDMSGAVVRKILSLWGRRAIVMTAGGQAFDLNRGPWRFCLDLVWVHNAPRSTMAWSMPIHYHANMLVLAHGETPCGFSRSRPDFGSVVGDGSGGFVNVGFGQGKAEYPFVEMLDCFPDAKIIGEPFAGTGAAILAAEHTGRTCLAAELDCGHLACCLERCQGAGLEVRRESE